MNEIAVVMEKNSVLNGKDEIIAEAEIESDQKDCEVIEDSEEINGSDADNSNDENASTTDPDVE